MIFVVMGEVEICELASSTNFAMFPSIVDDCKYFQVCWNILHGYYEYKSCIKTLGTQGVLSFSNIYV